MMLHYEFIVWIIRAHGSPVAEWFFPWRSTWKMDERSRAQIQRQPDASPRTRSV